MPMRNPKSNMEEFRLAVAGQLDDFETAPLVRRVASGNVTMEHYHAILTTLFHQTMSSPYTFAKAAACCPWRFETAKEYLLRHAEEERTHWRWVLDDLANTGYGGENPRELLPHPTCEAYVSFNERVAEQMPVARLAIARVLEGIGARFGGDYGGKLLQLLGLKPGQASFFISHGETDKRHVQELDDVIDACRLTEVEWGWMTHAASVGGQLYRAMYGHEEFA